MKKIYSFIAVASLLTSVFSFTSCQKDEMPATVKTQTLNQDQNKDQNKDNGQDQNMNQDQTKSQTEYKYYYALSDDALALYDVQLTANLGGKTQTIALSNNMEFADPQLGVYISGKTTFDQTFKVDEGKSVSVACTVKLKSNWQSIAKGMSKIYLTYAMDFKKPCMDKDSHSHSECYTSDDAALQSKLEAFGQQIASSFNAK